jgi:uncharacterized membrane protein YgcG
MKFFGWKRAISFVFAALATLEIAAAPAQNVQTVTVPPGQSVTINSKGEVQTQGAPQGQAQGQPAAQPQGQGGGQFTPQQLDDLLAPIALYPDALLGQVLAASENPQEVIDAGNWMGTNGKGLKDDALDKASKKAGFSPPMQSLLHFPDVVDMMANQIDWTRQLGQAMKADQKAVLASVQRLRDQAVAAGSLKSNDKQTVETKQEGNTTVVVVQPANPQVIYVPQYDPQKVYTPPPEKKEEEDEGVSEETAVMASLLSFGVGMAVGAAAWGGGCCYPSWGYGGVYYGRSVYVAPVYRPAYGGAWGYSNAYHRSGYYANNQNRLTVNNNNYYNRFNNNQNLQNRANTNTTANRTGARASATPGAGTNRQPPTREQAQAAAQGRMNERQAAAGTGGTAPSGDRAANAQAQRQSAAASTGGTAPSGDRLANAQAQRQSAGGSTGGTTPSGDRLASAQAQRQSMPASDRPSTSTPSGDRGFSQGSSGSGAFGGGGSSGRAASASSSRGRSSMRGGRGGGGRRGR